VKTTRMAQKKKRKKLKTRPKLKQKPITRSLTEQKKNEKSDRKINTREKRMTNKQKT